MKPLWDSIGPKPVFPSPSPVARIVGVLRILALAAVLATGLAFLLLLRLFEGVLFQSRRPITSRLVQIVCKICLAILGIRVKLIGALASGCNALVSNHSSWLDIFVLNAVARGFFVAKSEVAAWPGIGWLARATGTIFVERKRAHARAHRDLLARRMAAGGRLIFFPEGTSTDGQCVLPFKSTLFDAFDLRPENSQTLQPISLIYHAPKGMDARIYGWWGDMSFAPHLIGITQMLRHGTVVVVAHDLVDTASFSDRKALAKACGDTVARGHAGHLPSGQGLPLQ